MARVRFQRAVCLAAAAMTAFDGLVVLWPEEWRTLAAGGQTDWGAILYTEIYLLGPLMATIIFRHLLVSRFIVCVLTTLFFVFAERLYSIQTDPFFDQDLIFRKIDPTLIFYVLLFCLPCWLGSLIAAPFMLWRRRKPS